MTFRYAVLGAGRQGVAAAYDLARHGSADRVLLVDAHEGMARTGARRVNDLVGKEVVLPQRGDVENLTEIAAALDGVNSIVSAVPYRLNLGLTDIAIRGRHNMCDLGGNTDVTRAQIARSADAKAAGISIVPDCGMGPGLNISLGVYAMSLLDEPRDVYIFDGGLPQHPTPPWNFALTFHIGGLTNEYAGKAAFLRNGQVLHVPGLSEVEILDLPSIGKLEAAVTTGGLSTMPWTFEGKLRTLENKTLRYPGHWARMRAYAQLGLLDLEPVLVGDLQVVPRQVFHALLEPRITQSDGQDVCIVYVRCVGLKEGRPAEATVSLVDYYDTETGLSAMERLTGWHASIVAIQAVQGAISRGVVPIELALPGDVAVAEMRKRGLRVHVQTRLV